MSGEEILPFEMKKALMTKPPTNVEDWISQVPFLARFDPFPNASSSASVSSEFLVTATESLITATESLVTAKKSLVTATGKVLICL